MESNFHGGGGDGNTGYTAGGRRRGGDYGYDGGGMGNGCEKSTAGDRRGVWHDSKRERAVLAIAAIK
jgi:hypothetical protein